MSEPLISPTELHALFLSCLFTDPELVDGRMPPDAVIVQGIVNTFGFHPGRLNEAKPSVSAWLQALPEQFQQKGGGGWTFLNACNDRNGEQWADEQGSMEQLFCLGLGLGLVKSLMPREMWDVLPGGMPYYMVLAS